MSDISNDFHQLSYYTILILLHGWHQMYYIVIFCFLQIFLATHCSQNLNIKE